MQLSGYKDSFAMFAKKRSRVVIAEHMITMAEVGVIQLPWSKEGSPLNIL